jgi:hypothetical protein
MTNASHAWGSAPALISRQLSSLDYAAVRLIVLSMGVMSISQQN